MIKWVLGAVALVALGAATWFLVVGPELDSPGSPPPVAGSQPVPRELAAGRHLTAWWDEMGPGAKRLALPAGSAHNIHPADYAGPAACRDCHPTQHQSWSKHPHRWMNALAG